MEEPTFDLRAYEPPVSLWTLIEQNVPEHEHDEIRNMLGASMIDQSLELHQEIETLLDIWQDYRTETTDNTKAKLPEPPGLRDRLVQEIQFFVDVIREKAKSNGVNPDRAIQLRHNTDIIEYAMDPSRPVSRCLSRPGTAYSRDGRETPRMCTPTGSDRASAASTLSEEIESMNDKLNFLKFDEVVQSLRSTLEEEIETLLRDIRFLYECLDNEATYRAEVQGTFSREPTIAELQQERTKMEKELLSNVPKTQPPSRPVFNNARNLPAVPVEKQNMPKQMNEEFMPSKSAATHQGTRAVGSVSKAVSSKPGPLKGSHDIPLSNGQKVDNAHKYEHEFSVKDKTDQKTSPPSAFTGKSVSQKNNVNSPSKVRSQAISPSRARLVTVDMHSGQVSQVRELSNAGNMLPSPPSSAKPSLPQRPTSAQRFRKMVMECRDST